MGSPTTSTKRLRVSPINGSFAGNGTHSLARRAYICGCSFGRGSASSYLRAFVPRSALLLLAGQNCGDAKAQAIVPEPRPEVAPKRRTAAITVVRPTAASIHPVVCLFRASGVGNGLLTILSVPIVVTPFPDISVHVVQSPFVRQLCADRLSLASAVGAIPSVLFQLIIVVSETVFRFRPRPARIFPFSFGRQSTTNPLAKTQSHRAN